MVLSRILACLVAFFYTAADAEITPWKIGGSGLDWAESDSLAILVDKASGAIQPVYIRPTRPVFSYLSNWGDWNPRELGYVDGERPRVVGGTRLIDGDSTSYLAPSSGGSPDGRTFTFDLAVPVPIFSFGFYTPSQGYRSDGQALREDVVPAYEMFISEQNVIDWREIADVRENFRADVRHLFPRQYVRYARYIRRLSQLEAAQITALSISSQETFAKGQAHKGTIGDFELYGEGVPQRVVYKTLIFDLEQPVNFGRLFWSATPLRMADGVPLSAPGASVAVQVEARAGTDAGPDIYYEFTDMGTRVVVDQVHYQEVLKNRSGSITNADGLGGTVTVTSRPKPGLRAGIEYDQDNWNFWSVPAFESGQSTGLRSGQFLQLKILLHSTDFDAYMRLDSLWIETSPVLATRVNGEVARLDDPIPLRGVAEVEMGERTDFVCDFAAQFGAGGAGFDAFRIRTGGTPMFKGLEMGEPLQAVEPAEVVEGAGELVVRLPRRISATSNEPIRVVFAAEVYDFAWTFDSEVFDSGDESLPQPVQGADVGEGIATNTLRVLAATARAEKIRDLRLSTSVVTPNGDGINDLLDIEYTLFGLPDAVAARFEVYALDGRQVAARAVGLQRSGLQRIEWDGRDESGGLLPPGLYLLGLEIEGEVAALKQMVPVGVAY
jgi:hypothetical protein